RLTGERARRAGVVLLAGAAVGGTLLSVTLLDRASGRTGPVEVGSSSGGTVAVSVSADAANGPGADDRRSYHRETLPEPQAPYPPGTYPQVPVPTSQLTGRSP